MKIVVGFEFRPIFVEIELGFLEIRIRASENLGVEKMI